MGSNNNSNNDSSSHGRCSKKQKQKQRAPQRGLGVAQLERIRLEEQGIFSSSSSSSAAIASSSSISNRQSSNFPTFHQSSSQKSFHRYRKSSNYDNYSARGGRCDRKDTASCSGEGIFPLWGSSSTGSSSIRTDSNPNWPVQRATNSSSSSSSTVINFHKMELPSNQSFYSNLSGYGGWAAAEEEEEEKTIGMKRAFPVLSQQDSSSVNGGGTRGGVPLLPPPPSFMYQSNSSSVNKQEYPSVVHHHHHHESPSSFNFGSGPVFNFSSSNPPYFRDGSSGWNVTWQPESRRAIRDDNGGRTATTFLTLGPSAVTATTAGRQVSDSSPMPNHPHFHRRTSTTKMLDLDPASHSHHHHHHHHQVSEKKGAMEEEEAAGDRQQQEVRHASSLFLTRKFMQDETNSDEHATVDLNLKL